MRAHLLAVGVPVFHVLIESSRSVMEQRIRESDAAIMDWRLEHLDAYERSRPWMARKADLILDTIELTPPEAADTIVHAMPAAMVAKADAVSPTAGGEQG